jgi:hypothetical protein
MATPKIKKKSGSEKPSILPRQGAVPCLVIIVIALVVIALFFFGALGSLGQK